MRHTIAGLMLGILAAPVAAQMTPLAPATPAGPLSAGSSTPPPSVAQSSIAQSSVAQSPTPSAPMPGSAAMSDYALGVGDQVRITVFNEPTLTGQYPVNANGAVSFPLIGDVHAAGLTPGAFGAAVQQKLAAGYLRNPRVAVDMMTFRPFYILGEVTKPGEYPATAGLSVVAAVATAQGFTYRAAKKWAFIKHPGETRERKVPLTDALMVQPGDTIRIGERFF